jgi:FKBP-type peptidyl-prolyl cis-trans isomerase (trigger factor)
VEAHNLVFKKVYFFAHENGNKNGKIVFLKNPALVTKIPQDISEDLYKVEFYFETFPIIELSDYKKKMITLKKPHTSSKEIDELFFKLKEEFQNRGIIEGKKKLGLNNVVLFNLKVFYEKKLLEEFSKSDFELKLNGDPNLPTVSKHLLGKEVTLGQEISFSIPTTTKDNFLVNFESKEGVFLISLVIKKVF